MKLGKAQWILLAMTALFVTFTLAFFLGRSSVHAVIYTERPAEVSAAERDTQEPAPEAEPTQQPLLDLNAATAAELELLPGIGSVLAERIIQWRAEYGPFVSTEQLMDVAGIGEGIYQNVEAMIYVEGKQ